MKTRQKLLTDEQWELIEPLLPKPKQRRDKRGRPPTPNRPCFEGILWILKRGIDLRKIQELMGHRTIQMTCRYAHIEQRDLLAAVETLVSEPSATIGATARATSKSKNVARVN